MSSSASIAMSTTFNPTAVRIPERLAWTESSHSRERCSICSLTMVLRLAKAACSFSDSCRPSSPSTMARARSKSSAFATFTVRSISASFSAMSAFTSVSLSRSAFSSCMRSRISRWIGRIESSDFWKGSRYVSLRVSR